MCLSKYQNAFSQNEDIHIYLKLSTFSLQRLKMYFCKFKKGFISYDWLCFNFKIIPNAISVIYLS